ncbi:TPA: hypothetical protein DCY65_03400 [Candidatus Acetothermia bacterium]|nr:hypothetical protein [Candidatus Acetothermia bacterium]
MRRKSWTTAVVVVIATVLFVAILWPPEDPLSNVRTVAIHPPNWQQTDSGQTIRVPFMDGLTVTLGRRDVRIVRDPQTADAVLVVDHVRVEGFDLRLDSGQLTGRLSATCVLTDLRTGDTRVMDFTLELRRGELRATFAARPFWQFWKRG